jgi:hypothetical protein
MPTHSYIDPVLNHQQELLAQISKLESSYQNELHKDRPFVELKKLRMEIKRFQQMLADHQLSHSSSIKNEMPLADDTQ